MKKSKFTEEQITCALHHHEAGATVDEVACKTKGIGTDLLPMEEDI